MPTFWNGVSKEDTLQELWSTSKALAQGELIEKKKLNELFYFVSKRKLLAGKPA